MGEGMGEEKEETVHEKDKGNDAAIHIPEDPDSKSKNAERIASLSSRLTAGMRAAKEALPPPAKDTLPSIVQKGEERGVDRVDAVVLMQNRANRKVEQECIQNVSVAATSQAATTIDNLTSDAEQKRISNRTLAYANLPNELMPQAMPTGPANNARPPGPLPPGAYHLQQGSAERNNPLYKGGRNVLGRESITAQEGDSTRYLLTSNQLTPSPPVPEVEEQREPKVEEQRENERSETEPNVIPVEANEGGVHDSNKSRKWIGIIAVVAAVLVIIVAVVVGVVVGTTDSDSTSSEETPGDPQKPPNFIDLDQVFEGDASSVLQAETIAAIQFGKANNPQLQAFHWLRQDPKLNQYSVEQKRQRLALASFYYATNGPNWFDNDQESEIPNPWLDYNLHECEWYSKASSQETCYNTTIILDNHRHQHVDYRSLALSGNPANTKGANPALHGALVPELGTLTKLETIDLGHQNLKGSIPTELLLLSATLKRIALEDCFFTGTIPDALYKFPRVLLLSRNNRLTDGTIPATVGINQDLTTLTLIDTNRRGTIPKELFQATKLQHILLNENQMTGILPTDIGLLGSTLQKLDLTANQFTGTIPSQIGLLGLTDFLVGGNNFSGLFPTEIGMLKATLEVMEVKLNDLSGLIPSEIGSLTKLNYLDLQSNDLSGVLPASLSQLAELKHLNVNNNQIEGLLRPELLSFMDSNTSSLLATWPKLEILNLASNHMTGSIPSEIGLLQSLQTLSLRSNEFETNLPEELSLLKSLEAILLEDTKISGSVPVEICSLPELDTFRVDCVLVECPPSCGCDCHPAQGAGFY